MIRLIILFLLLLMPTLGHTAGLSADVQGGAEADTISLRLPREVRLKIFTLDSPPRLVIDIPHFTGARDLALPKNFRGAIIRGVRVGQFDPRTVRVVYALSTLPKGVETRITGQSARIVVRAPSGTPATNTNTNASSAAPAKADAPAPSPAPKKEPKKDKKKYTVVIDAGHGGQDPGAQGPGGTYEKDIVLAYAKALKKALNDTGRYRAVLTRDSDYFILLRERVAIARKEEGDLFLSLHADSAMDGARGLSVYTLSDTASDKEAEALAARENRADVLSGMDLSHESEDVAGILISLAQRETNMTSGLFADLLVRALNAEQVRLLVNAHRFAGFAVLKAPDMPSVLVETGFLSHPEEEKLLRDAKYRARMVRGLVKGIDAFFKKRQEGLL